MESFKGIQDFIEYKKKVEREQPLLTLEPRLVTVDGPDGVGKSTISKAIFERLKEKFGDDAVVFVNPTNLSGSSEQKNLYRIVKSNHLSEKQVDRIYAAGVNRAYGELIAPALKEGKIVVVDRSEVDLLRYAIETGDDGSMADRLAYIKSGSVTHRLWAGNRIFINGKAEEVWRNLEGRPNPSIYDPKSLEDVEKRMETEREAERKVESIASSGKANVVRRTVQWIEDEEERAAYIDTVADEIAEKLSL